MSNATKSISQILRENICTMFNLLNLMIAVALAAVGAWKNILFIFIINTVVGIVQEIKAKRQIERLTLLAQPDITALHKGKEVKIGVDEIQKGDVLVLSAGSAICTDCVVQEGQLEVNESILTGESEPVVKRIGDRLLSGSSVIAGRCLAKAECSADECFTAQMVGEVKRTKDGIADSIPLLVFLTVAASYHAVCERYVRAEGDTLLYARQGLLNTLLVVSLNILFLMVLRLGVTGYVLSVGLADAACTMYLVCKRRLWRNLTRHPDRKLLEKMLHYSIPLIPTTVFWWITSVSDRYMISAMLGSEANGIYTVANKLPTMLTLLSGVLMQAWQYSAVREAGSSLEEQAAFYSNVWLALLSAMFVACSAMAALAKIEIRMIANAAYYRAWQCVPVLCAAMLFSAFTSFMGSVYTVKRRSELSLETSLLGAGINIGLNALLIPSPYGNTGGSSCNAGKLFFRLFGAGEKCPKANPVLPVQKDAAAEHRGSGRADSIYLLRLGGLAGGADWCCWGDVLLVGRKQIVKIVGASGRGAGRQ